MYICIYISSPRPRSRASFYSALAEYVSRVFRPPFFVPSSAKLSIGYAHARCVSDDAFAVVLTKPPSLVNHFVCVMILGDNPFDTRVESR